MFTDSPSFTCGHNYEMEENGELQPKCEPEGEPTPIKTWLTEGGEKTSQQRWTKHDSGKYILTATNKLGTAIHSMYIDVLCKSHCLNGFVTIYPFCCRLFLADDALLYNLNLFLHRCTSA